METFSWRYQPEFIIAVLINGQPAEDFSVLPSAAARKALDNYGFITRTTGGKLTGFGRQVLNGTNWAPAYAIDRPLSFSFWLSTKPGDPFRIPGIFNDPVLRFGKPVFYANNLSTTGEIDADLSGNILELLPDPLLADEKKAALSTYTPAAAITPGQYTAVKARKISAGAAMEFYLSRPISPLQGEASLDFRPFPGGAHLVVLEGSPSLQEKLIPDEAALAAGVQGMVDIYKDAWRAPAEAIEYRINFIT
ncbi:hypothetical protein EDD80_10839 [Anseongella ginsenosidimutans]|uniref:Uncharacterized protein n=1 Tax=Anseongella ginsenosidimutans TaxID=496056 RepID=A0A4R3KNW7_9SPHI|nr:hypothetical protein [Anseongella ginsenosidimutans]QEC53866.1 hypothetical protein FRZ59_17055 [Anseongella ginsenosidimutans]TCS86248.1 hypothetical protein EDD80_10839 [Anseongella ginsenosidimutans]